MGKIQHGSDDKRRVNNTSCDIGYTVRKVYVMGKYLMNAETQKLEMYFDKSEYMDLSEDDKQSIKSNFLFSRRSGAWISRAKYPNTYRAEQVAKKLGLEYEGMQGETISYEEQLERKAERAEARAERYETRAENAERRADALQKPINDMHGDIAFFTQPNINSAGGRAFTSYRNRLFKSYERGIEEFKKSEYYLKAAETARQTAKDTKPTDKGFCMRRIEEAQKDIRKLKKNLEHYEKIKERLENGETIKNYSGEQILLESIIETIERTEMQIETCISKEAYYSVRLDELGGITYNKSNVHIGDKVRLYRSSTIYEVVKVNPKTIYYAAFGLTLSAKYAEIKEIVSV